MEFFYTKYVKEQFSNLPVCPLCNHPPKIEINECGNYSGVSIKCKKHPNIHVYTSKSSLHKAVDSAKSQWRRLIRKNADCTEKRKLIGNIKRGITERIR